MKEYRGLKDLPFQPWRGVIQDNKADPLWRLEDSSSVRSLAEWATKGSFWEKFQEEEGDK
jgi:hypothetical protein